MLSYRKLADKYKISRGQVENILKARAEYENADLENLNPKTKMIKLRKTHFEAINELM